MTDVGWYSQSISLNSLNLVKFYVYKHKSTGRGSLITKKTILQFYLYRLSQKYHISLKVRHLWMWSSGGKVFFLNLDPLFRKYTQFQNIKRTTPVPNLRITPT
jgi:hypothetical protein